MEALKLVGNGKIRGGKEILHNISNMKDKYITLTITMHVAFTKITLQSHFAYEFYEYTHTLSLIYKQILLFYAQV